MFKRIIFLLAFLSLETQTFARIQTTSHVPSLPIASSSFCASTGWVIGIENTPPFINITTENITGLNIDIIKALAKKLHCECKFIEFSRKRQYILSQYGSIDIVLSARKSIETSESLYLFKPYIRTLPVFVILEKNKKKFKLRKFGDIKKQRFSFLAGVHAGRVYNKKYLELMSDPVFRMHLNFYNSNSKLIRDLTKTYIDVAVFPNAIEAREAIRIEKTKQNFSFIDIKIEDKETGYNYIGYSKKSFSTESAKTIDNTLQKMRTNGELTKIMKKYLTNDEIKKIQIKTVSLK